VENAVVAPNQLESKLKELWELSSQKNCNRSCLFTLLIFLDCEESTSYVHGVIRQIVETFPCRVLFVVRDASKPPHLTTTLSLLETGSGKSGFACDQIEVHYSGDEEEKRIPFLLLPYLVPDLPVTLVWMGSPLSLPSLAGSLEKYADRILFDSEHFHSLSEFAECALKHQKESGCSVGDLNWARTDIWRELLASYFRTSDKWALLQQISKLKICYNGTKEAGYQHTELQAWYLEKWLANQLRWKLSQSGVGESHYRKDEKSIVVELTEAEPGQLPSGLSPGAILSIQLYGEGGLLFQFARTPGAKGQITIHFSTSSYCALPLQVVAAHAAGEHSLVREVMRRGQNPSYQRILESLDFSRQQESL